MGPVSRNGIYNITGALVRTAVALVTIRYLIEFAGLAEFGIWTLAAAIIGLVSIAESALNITATVFVSRDTAPENGRELSEAVSFLSVLAAALALVAAAILFAGADTLANLFPSLNADQRQSLASALRIGSLWALSRLPQQIALGMLQGFQRYGLMNVLLTLQSIATGAGLVLLAQRGEGTIAFTRWQVYVSAAALLIHTAAAWIVCGTRLAPRWNTTRAHELGAYAWWTGVTTMGTVIFSQADRLVVGRFLGISVEGIYAAITAVTAQINSLSAMPVQPLLAEIGRLERDEAYVVPRLRNALRTNAFVALSLSVVLFAFANRVLQSIAPNVPADDYVTAFRAAVVIYALYSLNATGYFLCLGFKATRATATIVLGGAMLSMILIAAGASAYGLLGAVLGNCGYQVAWLLTGLGMKHARVAATMWIGWLARPLLVFGAGLVLCSFISGGAWRAVIASATIALMIDFSSLRVALLNKLWRARCILKPGLASFVLVDGSRFKYPADSIIGFSLFTKTFETSELKFIQEKLRPGAIFIDVGANGGIYTLIAAKRVGPEGRVIAFEPDPRNVALLRENIALNKLTNVTVVAKAVSSAEGTGSLAISRDGAMNSLAKTTHGGQQIEKWETVETTTLDQALREAGVSRVDVIKIDVEGAERMVLEGARETLANNRDAVILFEATDLAATSFNYTACDLLKMLLAQGFTISSFDGATLAQMQNVDDPRIGRELYNFVATRAPLV
jgi:FkbM family methyltransferase